MTTHSRRMSLAGVLVLFLSSSAALAQGTGTRGENPREAVRAFIDLYIRHDLEADVRKYMRDFRIDEVPADARRLREVWNALINDGIRAEIERPQGFRPSVTPCRDENGRRVGVSSNKGDRGGPICLDPAILAGSYFALDDADIVKRIVASVFHEKAHQHGFEHPDPYLLSGYVRPRVRSVSVRHREAAPRAPGRGTLPDPAHPDTALGAGGGGSTCLKSYETAIEGLARKGSLRKQFQDYSKEMLETQKRELPGHFFGASLLLGGSACAFGLAWALLPGAGWLIAAASTAVCTGGLGAGVGLDAEMNREISRERAAAIRYNESVDAAARAMESGTEPHVQMARLLLEDRQFVYALLSEAQSGSLRTLGGLIDDLERGTLRDRVQLKLNYALVLGRLQALGVSTSLCAERIPSAAELGIYAGIELKRDGRPLEIVAPR